jgi:hypothetical protein
MNTNYVLAMLGVIGFFVAVGVAIDYFNGRARRRLANRVKEHKTLFVIEDVFAQAGDGSLYCGDLHVTPMQVIYLPLSVIRAQIDFASPWTAVAASGGVLGAIVLEAKEARAAQQFPEEIRSLLSNASEARKASTARSLAESVNKAPVSSVLDRERIKSVEVNERVIDIYQHRSKSFSLARLNEPVSAVLTLTEAAA